MVRWHYRLNGCEFEQTRGDSEGQASLLCCYPWSCKELNTTEWRNNNSVHVGTNEKCRVREDTKDGARWAFDKEIYPAISMETRSSSPRQWKTNSPFPPNWFRGHQGCCFHHRPAFRVGESIRGYWHLPELRGTHQHRLASCVCNLHSGMVLLSCPRCGQVQLRHGQQSLTASTLCPWSASALGAWLPPPRFQRMGANNLWRHNYGTVTPSFFPISPLWTGSVCPVPLLPLCILKAYGRFGFTDSWGMCLRMNLTLSLTYIWFTWYLEETLDFELTFE